MGVLGKLAQLLGMGAIAEENGDWSGERLFRFGIPEPSGFRTPKLTISILRPLTIFQK